MTATLKSDLQEDVSHLVPSPWGGSNQQALEPVGPFERCVYYCRFSTDLQNESSIERQVDGHNFYVRVNNLTPRPEGHVFADRGHSGAWLEGRDALAQVLELARAKAFDKLLVEDLDRLSRDVLHVIQIHRELKQLGIEIHVTGNGMGRVDDVQAVFFGLFGMMQRTSILQRTAAGRWRAALKGRNVGGVPYGYRPGPERGTLVVFEPEAKIIRMIFEWFDKGLSVLKIAVALNQKHIPSPNNGLWTPTTLLGHASDGSGILRNPKLVGVFVFGKRKRTTYGDGKRKRTSTKIRPRRNWVMLLVPEWQIVERRLYVRVMNRVRLFEERAAAAAKTREGKDPTEKRSKRSSLIFHGRYFCECGNRMETRFPGNTTVRKLSCHSARLGGACKGKLALSTNFAEVEILREIRDNILCPGALEVFVEEYVRDAQRAEDEKQATKIRLVEEIRRLDHLIKASIRDSLLAESNARDLDELREGWNRERAACEAELDVLPPPRTVPQVDPASIVSLKEQIDALIVRMPFQEKTVQDMLLVAALRSLVQRVVVKREKGEKSYRLDITACLAGLAEDTTSVLEADVPVRTVERPCPPPGNGYANGAERIENFRRLAESGCFALTDEEWGLVAPLMDGRSPHPQRLVMDAALFYLRTDSSVKTLPAPYDAKWMRHALHRLVVTGSWRRAYDALSDADCAAVAGLDTSGFANLERMHAGPKSAAAVGAHAA